jgi:hypothetical protein
MLKSHLHLLHVEFTSSEWRPPSRPPIQIHGEDREQSLNESRTRTPWGEPRMRSKIWVSLCSTRHKCNGVTNTSGCLRFDAKEPLHSCPINSITLLVDPFSGKFNIEPACVIVKTHGLWVLPISHVNLCAKCTDLGFMYETPRAGAISKMFDVCNEDSVTNIQSYKYWMWSIIRTFLDNRQNT